MADLLIAYLQDHPEAIPVDVILYILRDLNPDVEASAHGPEGHTNEHGMDMNPNFSFNWKMEWDKDSSWNLLPVTAGISADSNPETNVLIIFIQQHNIDALISYHSSAVGIFSHGFPIRPIFHQTGKGNSRGQRIHLSSRKHRLRVHW